jgi:hypothetical protein
MSMTESQAVATAKTWAQQHGADSKYEPARWIIEMLMQIGTRPRWAPDDGNAVFFLAMPRWQLLDSASASSCGSAASRT